MIHARKRHLVACMLVWLAQWETASGQVPVAGTPGTPPIVSLGAPRVIAVSGAAPSVNPQYQVPEPRRFDQAIVPVGVNTVAGPSLVQQQPVGIVAQPGAAVATSFIADNQARSVPVNSSPAQLPAPRPMAMPSAASASPQVIQPAPMVVQPMPMGQGTVMTVPQPGTVIGQPTVVSPGRVMPMGPGGTVIETIPGEVIIDGDADQGLFGTNWLQRLKSKALGGSAFQNEEFFDPDKPHLNRYRFYASFEYMAWALTGNQTPALVTSSSNLAAAPPGALYQPGTNVLYGGDAGDLATGMTNGGRVKVGMWWNRAQDFGTELTFFGMGNNDTSTTFQSFGNTATPNPVLGRPFVNALNNRQAVEFVGVPGSVNQGSGLGGTVTVSDQTQFYGGDLNARFGIRRGCNWTIDALAGVRNLNLNDTLSINETLYGTSGRGDSYVVNDSFSTQNTFWGGQLGVMLGYNYKRWAFDTTLKVALGQTNVNADISGNTLINSPGVSNNYQGGLLAQRTNIGNYSDNHFSVVPELGFTVGYYLTPRMKVFAGYNILYWTNVARSGGLIDPVVNPNLVPPGTSAAAVPARPAQQIQFTDLWAQGVNVGLEIRY
jgi:Putative beta barrel porin-7 (BBP7)